MSYHKCNFPTNDWVMRINCFLFVEGEKWLQNNHRLEELNWIPLNIHKWKLARLYLYWKFKGKLNTLTDKKQTNNHTKKWNIKNEIDWRGQWSECNAWKNLLNGSTWWENYTYTISQNKHRNMFILFFYSDIFIHEIILKLSVSVPEVIPFGVKTRLLNMPFYCFHNDAKTVFFFSSTYCISYWRLSFSFECHSVVIYFAILH